LFAKERKEIKMNSFEEDVPMPLSPMAGYFSNSLINVFVLCVVESEIPIDDSKVQPLLKNKLLPVCSRFSSIMVRIIYYYIRSPDLEEKKIILLYFL